MAWAEILVHVDNHPNSAARLAVAVGLASQHGAHLTALLVTRHKNPSEAEVAAVRESFEQLVAGAGIAGRWLCIDGSVAELGTNEILLDHAHFCDLLIVGQGSRASANAGVPFDLPERAVLESGRPVLVVPYAGFFPAVGERVLVAWKAGPESTRAVNDALPLLRRSREVEILARPAPPGRFPEGDGFCAGLREYLARQGVKAEARPLMVRETPVGDALLNRAFDEGFDLLVVGVQAYGNEGRLTFGSVARHLLKEMTVPVLMSH